MTRLVLIRHGQSEANLKSVFAGHTDAPLAELGKAQAEQTAAYVTKQYQVDGVYASDLKRAYATGKAVADCLGQTVIPCEKLREIYAGAWENQPFQALIDSGDENYETWRFDIGRATCTGGESVKELQARIIKEITRIAEENTGRTVVLATHATPIRVFQCHCEHRPIEELKDIPWVSNASVTEAIYENGAFRLVQVGYDAHLEGIKTVLPKNV